ncbi:hypothetical protein LIER_34055 [Lithospermum erythrorhizon]|uniref:DUF4283 domain-containing protein n=1 Tax=Lithospermum erythrorhizon TaxID=34254 RepID=A0AAV3S250_LITER
MGSGMSRDTVWEGVDGVRFLTNEAHLHVLNGGPYMAIGKTLMMKIVDEGVIITDDLFMHVPTWVLLHDVPLSVWSVSGLSKLASKVGIPMYTDKVTKDRSRMNYARCLVEVNVGQPPVMEFGVTMSGGRKYVQKVSYEHYSDYCCDCKKFGHNIFKFPNAKTGTVIPPPKPSTVARPKPKGNAHASIPGTPSSVPLGRKNGVLTGPGETSSLQGDKGDESMLEAHGLVIVDCAKASVPLPKGKGPVSILKGTGKANAHVAQVFFSFS